VITLIAGILVAECFAQYAGFRHLARARVADQSGQCRGLQRHGPVPGDLAGIEGSWQLVLADHLDHAERLRFYLEAQIVELCRIEAGIQCANPHQQWRVGGKPACHAGRKQHVRDFLGIGMTEPTRRGTLPIFSSASRKPVRIARELHRRGIGEPLALARDAAWIRRPKNTPT
jgi:hypothetical protein